MTSLRRSSLMMVDNLTGACSWPLLEDVWLLVCRPSALRLVTAAGVLILSPSESQLDCAKVVCEQGKRLFRHLQTSQKIEFVSLLINCGPTSPVCTAFLIISEWDI
jgi:hypothetical protein